MRASFLSLVASCWLPFFTYIHSDKRLLHTFLKIDRVLRLWETDRGWEKDREGGETDTEINYCFVFLNTDLLDLHISLLGCLCVYSLCTSLSLWVAARIYYLWERMKAKRDRFSSRSTPKGKRPLYRDVWKSLGWETEREREREREWLDFVYTRESECWFFYVHTEMHECVCVCVCSCLLISYIVYPYQSSVIHPHPLRCSSSCNSPPPSPPSASHGEVVIHCIRLTWHRSTISSSATDSSISLSLSPLSVSLTLLAYQSI